MAYSAFMFIGLDTALAFWALLLPHGFQGGALTRSGDDDNVDMDGWQENYNEWWIEFLTKRSSKGISKDTWIMVCFILISIRIIPHHESLLHVIICL